MAERAQEKKGLDAILSPRSVAVVGASSEPGAVGHTLLASILDGHFHGPVYAVNPHAKEVLGHPAYRSILDVPEAPELAIIAVPAAAVVQVAEDCGRKGVRGLVVVSAGFREADAKGSAREDELRAVLARYGMRMVGPNCLGVVNNDPAVRLHATFAPRALLPGTAALVTQSGAVGIALLEHARHVGLGVARFVSMGNKTDVSGNDLLLLWEDDPAVKQVLLYLENFGNPRNFVRIARRLSRTKPLTLIKSGRTTDGGKAAVSHTGALLQSDDLVDALLESCGVLRADTVEEFFDIGVALASQRPLSGNRIAIVTNSGGPAILAVDRLQANGLRLAQPGQATWDRLRPIIPSESHAANPLDLLAGGTPANFAAAIRAFQDDPNVDAVLAIWTPIAEQAAEQAQAIAAAFSKDGKAGVAVTFGHGPGTPSFDALTRAHVPVYAFPEGAVASLGALAKLGAWRATPEETAPHPAVDAAAVERALAAKPGPGGWLPMRDAIALAQAYGLRFPRHAWVTGASEAAVAAKQLRPPYVLKMDAPGLVHKTEAGAVRLNLPDATAVEAAYRAASGALRERGLSAAAAIVMETAPEGPELLVGATQDPVFGPVLAVASGGIYTEVLKDVRVALAPVTKGEAQRLVSSLRGAPLLSGQRGAAPADLGSVQDAIVRLARLSADQPRVAEVEVNPLRALPEGALALDVRVRVA